MREVRIADEVHRHELLLGVLEDFVQRARLGGGPERRVDVRDGGGALDLDGQLRE